MTYSRKFSPLANTSGYQNEKFPRESLISFFSESPSLDTVAITISSWIQLSSWKAVVLI